MKSHKIFFSVFILSFQLQLVAQVHPVMPAFPADANFLTVQNEMNDYYKDHPGAKGFKQWKRREWFLEPRLYPSGESENLTLKTWKAYEQYQQTQADDRATHGSWTFMGPTTNPTGQGRLNTIAFHPTNANIIYVGSSNGGVWKTTNGGTNWFNITPHIPLISIADIKLSPADPNVVYILTGDGDPSPPESQQHGQSEVSSIGILRSPDGGVTWLPTAFNFDHPSLVVPTKLMIHPTDVNTQYVASENGLYRTTDHWENWDIEYFITIFDIEFKPGDPDIMYASGHTSILKSTDGGDNWNPVSDPDFSFAGSTRIELAVAPNNASIVYALAGNWDEFKQFVQSSSEGSSNTWTSQNTTATTFGAFSEYCIGLVVDPTDWTDVFGGMQWINRSLNQGVNWTGVQGPVHADIHDVAYAHGALWVCCDGGLYKSINEGDTWTNLSAGLAITEIYRITGTPQNTDRYFAGCQDNGTMRRNGVTTSFEAVWGGDGMTPMIDYTNSNIVYGSQQNGFFGKSTTGGNSGSFNVLSVPGGEGNWITPAIMDPVHPDTIFIGKQSIIRSKNAGVTWDSIGSPSGIDLNCLAQGTNNRNRLYASSESSIYRTDNALIATGPATWFNIGAEVPNLFITGIAVDPANSLNAFVSLSGYTDGYKVYETVDGGVNWESISGSLPNVPVNCIEYDENGSSTDALYIGTDIGVFYRDDAIGDWIYFSNNIPATNISDLYINDGDNTIVAGTYGRGLWRSSKYDGCVSNIVLDDFFNSTVGGTRFYSASNSITSEDTYRQDYGTEIHFKAGSFIDLVDGFSAGGVAFLEGRIGPCPDVVTEPMMSPFVSQSRVVMTNNDLIKLDVVPH